MTVHEQQARAFFFGDEVPGIPGFRKPLFISLIGHLIFFLALVLFGRDWSHSEDPMLNLDSKVVWVSDIRMGKGKSGLHPRVSIPPQVKKEKLDVTNLPLPEMKKKRVKDEEVVSEKPMRRKKKSSEGKGEKPLTKAELRRRAAMQAALSDLRKDLIAKEAPLGGGKGDEPGGGSIGVQEVLFRHKIKQRIEANFHMTDYEWVGKYRDRKVQVMLRLDESGNVMILNVRSSGVRSLDENLLDAIKKSQPFVAPTEELRDKYTHEKIVITFSPGSLEFE